MTIGIDASRAFAKNRTGIEEYSYQVIKHLRDELKDARVILYIKKKLVIRPPLIDESPRVEAGNWQLGFKAQEINFKLPTNWQVKALWSPRLWTQLRLSLEMLLRPVDILFVPAHTVPVAHPKNTVVTIHGLEYEVYPKAYSLWQRVYMRQVIKNSCRWARKIIAVSKNTKKDLMQLYKIPEKKIGVIYEGTNENIQYPRLRPPSRTTDGQATFSATRDLAKPDNIQKKSNPPVGGLNSKPYLLFIGRIEKRKNILGIVKAFELLKKKYALPHKLVLAGSAGYGKQKVYTFIYMSEYAHDILLPGYVSEKEKQTLMKNAAVFVFPTLYEGFGLPILEAQSVGTPVVASDNSSIPEVAGGAALLVNPENPREIAKAIYSLVDDKTLRDDIIQRGRENVKKFSWEKCAREIAEIIQICE